MTAVQGSSRLPADLSSPNAAHRDVRWAIWLMILASAASLAARIATVRATTGETPMLSANDRSRWCTVCSLVDEGTYAIDSLVQIRHPETKRRFWKSIDMVRHRGPDGREHYYSSKPPLFPTLLAGEYWALRQLTGLTLADHPFQVMRWMLVITNLLPLLVYFGVLWRCVERLAVTRAALLYVMAVATWGTFLTTFGVTINNHLPAAIAVLLAAAGALRIWHGATSWWLFAGTGLAAAFAVANELPALAFFACITLLVLWRAPCRTFTAYLPAAAVVAAGFFGTNYLAHGTWVPPYAHRSDGPVVAQVPVAAVSELDQERIPASVRDALARAGMPLSDVATVRVRTAGQRWSIWNREGAHRYAAVATADAVEIRHWGNWYDYEGSYWNTERQGVDRGEASPGVYAFHAVLGHHGVLSLSPVWLLSIWGVAAMVRGRPEGYRLFGWMVLAVTAVCLVFYISRPMLDRNYGGVSCGFRWMFWFIPLWLICLVPAADRLLHSRWGRILALLLLAISVFSASYCAANPWSHPWLWQWGEFAGWWPT